MSRHLRDVDSHQIIDHENEDPAFFDEFTRVIDNTGLPHAEEQADDVEVESDNYIGMEFAMSCGSDGELMRATVRRRMNDEEGKPIGKSHTNPLLDSRRYEVEYADGNLEELTANVIAENLISQVDEDCRRQMMLGKIMDHRILPDAISKSKGTYVNKYGVKGRKITTRGWEILVEWLERWVLRLGSIERFEGILPC